MGDVDPEACDAAVEPEAQDPLELFPHLRVPPVEVGLLAREVVQVVAPAPGVERPGGAAAEHRLPVVRDLVRPDVQVGALAEPRMPVGRVVRDEVEQHADAAPVSLGDEPVDVLERAELRMDAGVVGDVIAPVDVRRGGDWVEPDSGDAQPLEVVELADHAGEVADPVAVSVGEGPRIDLIEDAVAPPRCSLCNDLHGTGE